MSQADSATLCIPKKILLNTLYSLLQFTPQHIFLHGTLWFLEHFAKCSREQSVSRNRVFQEAKCTGEQSVSRNKVFQRSKFVEVLNVLRSKVWVCKVYQGAKGSREQSVCQPIKTIYSQLRPPPATWKILRNIFVVFLETVG